MNSRLLRKFWRIAAMLIALLASIPTMAATGRITDSVTGKPIAGATVYATWHESAFDGRIVCGGYTVATTDANGDYDIGISMTFHTWWHDAQYWVVAPGHRGSDTRTSKDWSAKLEPLGNLPLDDKLRAIPSAGRIDNCLTAMQTPYVGVTQFQRATRAAQFAAMCDPANGDTTPQTDEFLRVIPTTAQAPLLWSVFVNPLLPRQTSHTIPVVARNNACALASTSDEFDPAYRPPTVPLTLRISLKNVDDGLPPKKIHVRLLWGARVTEEQTSDAEHRDLLPRYAAVAMADEDGNADFLISTTLLDKNMLEHGPYDTKPSLNFVAIPYADDRIGLDPANWDFKHDYSTWTLSPKLRSIAHPMSVNRDPRGGSEGAFAMHVAPAGWVQPNVQVDTYAANAEGMLATIAQRETKRRSDSDHYNPDLTTIHVYAWQWPATDLYWRAFDLITLPADVEADTGASVRLQRNELAQAFDALCAGDLQTRAPDPRSVLHALWWLDAQIDGAVVANQNAQQRAQLWDDGARCGYRDGKLISVGNTQPPNPLTLEKVCTAWHAIRGRLDGAPATNAPSVTQMRVDFSQRRGACPHLRDFGSSM